jgi:hypothetical protein
MTRFVHSMRMTLAIGVVLFCLLQLEAGANPVISIPASPVVVTSMSTYSFVVRVEQVDSLFGYGITLTYNAADIVITNVVPLGYLRTTGGASVTSFTWFASNGELSVNEARLTLEPERTPSGDLFVVYFQAAQFNVTKSVPVVFSTCLMRDQYNTPIPCTSSDGLILLFPSNVRARAKVLLQGPYQSGGTMNTLLRDANYSAQRIAPHASAPLNFGAQLPVGVVDWVLVELRATPSGATLASKAAFLRSDGLVVAATSGTNDDVEFAVVPGSYYLIIRHHNHIDIMSSTAVALSFNPASTYDFSADANAAYGAGAQRMMTTGVYALWSGDASGDDYVDAADRNTTWNQRQLNGYYRGDLNLDGSVNSLDLNIALNNRFIGSNIP